jgi:hypothetical protein
MPERWTFDVPEEQSRPKGPARALDEAVEILGPFDHANAKTSARDEVIELARGFLRWDGIVRGAPRSKEIVQRLTDLQLSLWSVVEQIQSTDDWTRFHLREKELSDLPQEHRFDASWMPEPASSNAGDFARLAQKFADFIDEPIATIRALMGGGEVIDQGGRQNHAERYVGNPKAHLVREAFDVFDNFHPGIATSAEGADFHTFVHRVYELATAEHDEDKAVITYLIKTLIKPLRELKAVDQEAQSIAFRLENSACDDPNYRDLERQLLQSLERQLELETPFRPLLAHIAVRQPPKKTPG